MDVTSYRKTRSTLYTEEKLSSARANIRKFDWAKRLRDDAVAKADRFLAAGYDYLWRAVPPQTLPRSYAVNQRVGSPVTGKQIDAYGNYPYSADPLTMPWKIKDPSSGYLFPTNDFGAYYASGLDVHGIFRPESADRSLLVNRLYPEKGPDWCVDDGYGWSDGEGNRYTFIAHYIHWFLWYGQGSKGLIENAVTGLRDAYVFTGERKYAVAGTILLDRIADVYPALDIAAFDPEAYLNSHGGTGQGKAIGCLWEQWVIDNLITAYDAFFPATDDPEIVAYLSAQAKRYRLPNPKTSGADVRRNIEDGIVRQAYEGVKKAQIFSTNGRTVSVLAKAAVVLDSFPETKEWLDFAFRAGGLAVKPYRITGGNLLPRLVNQVDRDGFPPSAGAGYNRLWLEQHQDIADVLGAYDKYPSADLYRNVKFRKMFAQYPLIMIDAYTPQIGDSGLTGKPGFALKMTDMLKAFERFGDPIYAQAAYLLNGNRLDGISGDVFSRDPDALTEKVRSIVAEHGPLRLGSVNLTGYGFAVLRDGEETGGRALRDLWMYYGRTSGHGHRDALNIGIHAFGLDLAPDLGYPEYTGGHPNRVEWVSNTISHNTVVVDKSKQCEQWVGIPRHFDDGERVKLIDAEAPNAYPQTVRYRRTTAYVRADGFHSYAVDFFRVKGGSDHHFSFHGAGETVSTEELTLISQPTGTYAGPHTAFGEKERDQPGGAGYKGSGFHYLRSVERDVNPPSAFSVEWNIQDTWEVLPEVADIRLRLTMLGDADEVALADGEPPRNKPGNPKRLKYLIVRRTGELLDSQFVSVIEAYDGSRFIRSVSRVPLKVGGKPFAGTGAAAVRVELVSGRTDYIVNSLDPDTTYIVDDKYAFKGFFGIISEESGIPAYGYMHDGTVLGGMIGTERGALTGTVVDFTKELRTENRIVVELDHSYAEIARLAGSYLYIETDGERNGSYRIERVEERQGNRFVFGIGDVTPVRGFADPEDFAKGFVYDIREGAACKIPLAFETVHEKSV
ncbi:heparinase II/III domain-containing protein [Paenibacillus mesophilus]|uniref:heparinase II/III domain-containing protein n=1 Tax=Paenibacillus mesophilus TaxID=2582849 RepID=UPI00130517A5|nr:heparinase II/III family protein [Paenibacillus mesophilus]